MHIINTECRRKTHYKFQCDRQEALVIINDLCKQMIKDNSDTPDMFMTSKGEYVSFEVEHEIDTDDVFIKQKPKNNKHPKQDARETFNALFGK